MELYVTENQPTASQREVCTRHREREYIWKIHARVPQQDFDIFKEINEYWATLPMEEQDAIFHVYERIHHIFSNNSNLYEINRLMDALRPLISQLFELHPQSKLDYWVRLKSNLLVPTGLPRTFDPNVSSRMTPERTYIEEDYRKLVPMAISMRIMIPIWGEFLKRIEGQTKPVLKEYTAFKLLALSNVMNCDAMKRLATYVSYTIPQDKSKDAAIIYGLGTEDFPEWVLANTIVSRLCRSDVSGMGDSAVLITFIHNYIREHPSVIEAQMGIVREKKPDGSGDSDTNYSTLEGFRIKEAVAAGDIKMVDMYVRTAALQVLDKVPMPPLALANRLAQKPGEELRSPNKEFNNLVRQALRNVKGLMQDELCKSQVQLAGWVLAEQVPVQSIPYLSKQTLLVMMAFAQAFLWYNGYPDLAALTTARSREESSETDRVMGDQREKISRRQAEELSQSFPYMRRSSSRSANARSTMMVFASAETVAKELGDRDWEMTLPDAWIASWAKYKNDGGHVDRRFRFPNDILPQVANLILELERRRAQHLRLDPLTASWQSVTTPTV
jgi:hypothetical protein